jgi:hypothetical protein
MKAVNKFGWRSAVVVTAIASATVIALAGPAGAHEAKGEPDVSCDEASVELASFPQSSSTITFHIKVNGTDSTKTTQFSGPSGTASVSISDLTTATGTLAIEAFASWTIDGGGKSDTAKLSKVCHEVPTTTGEPPIEVGGIQAERGTPASASSAEAAAAVAVTADPKFTG